jgi:hypothetical protein
MKKSMRSTAPLPGLPLTTELLLLPDGQVLVHNLTPAFARLLAGLNPECEQIASRTRLRSASAFTRFRRDKSARQAQHPVSSIPHPPNHELPD